MQIILHPVDDHAGRRVRVRKLPFSIGRTDDCDLQLPCSLVSRRHAELRIEEDRIVLRDLGSTNGTFVNGQPVADEQVLDDGDVVTFAVMQFQMHRQDSMMQRIHRFWNPEANVERIPRDGSNMSQCG